MHRTRFVAAIAALAVTGLVAAGPVAPTEFDINSFSSSTDGSPVEDFTIGYEWGSEDYIDSIDDGAPGFFNITVNSGESQRPGFDFEMTFDYSAYDIGFFLDGSGPGIHELTMTDVYTDGSIVDVYAKDVTGAPVGSISTDGNSIFFSATVEEVLAAIGGDRTSPITIQFAVPAPGAMAIFGLAGLAGARRRRSA